jgi:hypothetical protein
MQKTIKVVMGEDILFMGRISGNNFEGARVVFKRANAVDRNNRVTGKVRSCDTIQKKICRTRVPFSPSEYQSSAMDHRSGSGVWGDGRFEENGLLKAQLPGLPGGG